jgi:hypothetical protein
MVNNSTNIDKTYIKFKLKLCQTLHMTIEKG